MEIWKDIKDYEGFYMVSNYGNVKSLLCKKERILRQKLGRNGYFSICLYKNKIKKTREIHQLVAVAFLQHVPCGYKFVVNHIDINRQNNNLNNLEIVTSRENSNRKHLKSSSKYVGVSWSKVNKKWSSNIVIKSKNKHLGYFNSEIEAHEAYQKELFIINNNS